ncbi:LysR family transcriptional regulator [Curvibacter sp. RS43]|uniref:LysR family transcriptional regulator n=1 Tax=Curvibacter microcysteis TaxID=3026419 RepID=A0ABT5M9T5_9BURK|nr:MULTISPECIES: LysR family transcriptional regulator [unclassified Curvibacter]MDD0811550.1 LysR family transcriptional regulator [Curvibacter sp. RS43]MDD0813353.1 LysR family transcriptional regulator [Curvibacter sp. HBC28]
MIDALKTFLAVARAGHFSEVAREQDVAVSSVTRKIDALETELGSSLFRRSSRRVALTDAGEQFVPRARAILSEIAEAKQALLQIDDALQGQITVTAPTAFGRRHVVPAVADFMQRHPGVEVDLHLSDQVMDLTEQAVDVAIRIGLQVDSEFNAVRLAPVRLVTCASPAYLARAGMPPSPLDLLQHECISVATPPAPSFVWRYSGVNRQQPLRVQGRFRTDDKDGMLQGALAGLGVVHIATWVVSDHLRDGRLVALFPQELSDPPQEGLPGIFAVRGLGRGRSRRSELFIQQLRESIGEPAWWDRQDGGGPGAPR